MSHLADADRFEIPRDLVESGHHALRRIGEEKVEGLLLWAGRVTEGAVLVEAVLLPRQHALRTDDGVSVIVDGAELHRVGVWLHQHGLELVGQVHSHPAEAYHSALDDLIPIATTQGALSLVVPDFAAGPSDLSTYAVYRLSGAGKWVEVRPHQVSDLLHVT